MEGHALLQLALWLIYFDYAHHHVLAAWHSQLKLQGFGTNVYCSHILDDGS